RDQAGHSRPRYSRECEGHWSLPCGQVHRLDKDRATYGSVNLSKLRHEGVTLKPLSKGGAKGGLESAKGRGEIGRIGIAGHVGVAGSIDGDAGSEVVTAAAEIGGVAQGRAGGVELRDEGVEGAAEARLESARGCSEVARSGGARHVGAAVGIHGDAEAQILVAAAEEGGVDQGSPCRDRKSVV